MPELKDKPLVAPLLDRFLEQNKGTDFRQSHQIVRSLRESIRRDLENLSTDSLRQSEDGRGD